jgi:hypothetical protein
MTTSSTLLLVVSHDQQNESTGYNTWTLQQLLRYNRDAVDAGTTPRWIPIAEVADPCDSRRIVETRLEAMKR